MESYSNLVVVLGGDGGGGDVEKSSEENRNEAVIQVVFVCLKMCEHKYFVGY